MNKQTLIKFIAGKASKEESEVVLRWIGESEDNRQYYNQMKNIWVVTNLPSNEATEEDVRELRSLGYYKKKVGYRMIISIAAVLLVPLLAFNLFFLLNKPSTISELKDQRTAYAVFSTNKGVKGRVVLPDGSKVWLNCDSYIKFPEKFTGNTRKVEFSGEGYFEVQKNPENPMIITTGKGVEVKVKGTTFNLSSYSNDAVVKATLYEGAITLTSVSATTGKKEVVDVKPMETATVFASSAIKVQTKADTVASSAWRKGDIIFDNDPMPDVLKKLERWHGVEFVVKNKSVFDYRFTAHFKSESIVQIMEMLKFCSPVTYSIKDNVVTLDLRN